MAGALPGASQSLGDVRPIQVFCSINMTSNRIHQGCCRLPSESSVSDGAHNNAGSGPEGFSGDSVVRNLATMQEVHDCSLGREDPLKQDMATHSSILAWRIPWDRGDWRATAHGIAKSQTRHD